MDSATNAFHELVEDMGKMLGLRAAREVELPRSTGYTPRLDVLWSRELSVAQWTALEKVRARVPQHGDAIPIAAWEVEGSDASTKGMQADLANMRVFGAPFGFLAVRGGTKDNLFERACRLARTQRHHFGDQAVVPLDTSWLRDFAQLPLSSRAAPWSMKIVKGGGGEGTWAERVRNELRMLGETAGFDVIESYRAPFPSHMELTRSEIDIAWTLAMPEGLRMLATAIGERLPDLKAHGLVIPERYNGIVVVAFEIENNCAKHGHGGLLNLASHGMAGVFVAGTKAACDAAVAAHKTYRESLPLSRVTVYERFMK